MKHYNKNKDNEEFREKVKGYRDTHRASETFLQWRENRKHDEHAKELKREESRRYRENNAEKVKELAKQHAATYYAKHKDTEEYKEKKKQYAQSDKGKAQRNKYQRERRHNDIAYKIRDNLSRRINKSLKHLGSTKSDNTIEYLDCSIEFFVEHIEAQFKDGMSWDNYGRDSERDCWEIDHIVPVNYNNPTVEEVIKRMHYSNCQPMWAFDNRSKSNRFVG